MGESNLVVGAWRDGAGKRKRGYVSWCVRAGRRLQIGVRGAVGSQDLSIFDENKARRAGCKTNVL